VDYYIGEESLLPIIVEQNKNYDKIGTKNVGDVEIDRMNLIGEGAYGYVFAGTFKGEKVAVKRVQLMDSRGSEKDFERSLEIQHLLNHRNVVQFKHFEKDDDFG
jgi:predicted Ser/Thr protein kinase